MLQRRRPLRTTPLRPNARFRRTVIGICELFPHGAERRAVLVTFRLRDMASAEGRHSEGEAIAPEEYIYSIHIYIYHI